MQPKGAPYFSGQGEWEAYLKWDLMVPCSGCGRRKIDDPHRYGLERVPGWPEWWVTEEICGPCWIETDD